MIVSRLTPSPADRVEEKTTPMTDAPVWVADRGDGKYRNPVLFADYSDPDAIRVGDEYWMTSSSFSHVPGLPILHSRDLVNWTLVNHALPRLVPHEHFATPRHGGGVWAPAIRHHAGKFWIYYPDPDFGIYVVTADDPRRGWSEPTLVCAGKGLIDPCPLWDDDGKAYLVHGWAKSRAGFCNRVTLRRLATDGLSVLDSGITIVDGEQMPGWHTIEGPKLYRRNGYYYVFAPAGGVAEGYQAVFRARKIEGPYESRIVLEQGSTPINGPHQGAWVDTPSGEHWFLHFQDRGPYGRVVHLQPVSWGVDDWPRMGAAGAGEVGNPVLVHTKPRSPKQPIAAPPSSDDFAGPTLGLQWQWQANPRADWFSLSRSAGLRLNAAPSAPKSLWHAPNLLLQKLAAPKFVATTRMTFAPGAIGDDAGLIVFGYSYAWLGLRQTSAGLRVAQVVCSAANEGGVELESVTIPAPSTTVTLRVSVAENAVCELAYSFDGELFVPTGMPFQATVSRWVGAKVGLFARSAPEAAPRGHADFAWFRMTE